MELGDRKIDGVSVYLKNLNNMLNDIYLEILKKDIEIARLKKGYQVKGVGANKEFVTLKDVNMK